MAVYKRLLMGFIVWLLCVGTAQARLDYTDFQRLPVMHEGRIKPLGRAAQITLKKISALDITLSESAALFARFMFDPVAAQEPPIFHVGNASIRHVLDLPEHPMPYYTFRELNQAFVKQADLIRSLREVPAKDITDDQRDLLDLYANLIYFEQVTGSMTLFLPLKKQDTSVYKMDNPEDLKSVSSIIQQGEYNQELRVIADTDWVSPWQAYAKDPHLPILKNWSDITQAYIAQDDNTWRLSTTILYQQSTTAELRLRLNTEIAYLHYEPDFLSLLSYLTAAGLALAFIRWRKPFLRYLSITALGTGLVLHGTSLAMRMIILHRPPVSDLYESFIFVGFLMVLTAMIYILRNRDHLVLFLTAFLAGLLQIFSFSIHPEFDSLKVLQAVLDTKFWLATHVILITSGYACCLLTSILAHAQIITQLWFPQSTRISTQVLYRRTYGFCLAALFLMVSGTVLGGIWADQSWGRFWGWDPKENGALLIILWIVWLLHGKVSGHIKDFSFMLGLAGLSLLVSLSWIGTNLLGVGLHAYGFIDSIATGMLVLIGLETLFLLYIWYRGRQYNETL